ncbi:MAG: HEAT repeat domain-containing protein [Anaerolineales bacterium]|nr:HEAT repeat domain-containing protein [Anaerolineales bacterium]
MTIPASTNLIPPLLAALQHPNPPVRAGAAIALGKRKDARAIEPLADLLEDPVHLVYTSAERALSLIGSLAVGTLMAVIQAPPSLDSASRAYEALRAIRDPQAIDLLIAATAYEEPFIRWGALEALGEMRAIPALAALIEAVRHPDETTRQHAITALGKLGCPEGIQPITTQLNEPNWQMRVTAVTALGRIGSEDAILPLLTAMRDPTPQVRETAGEMLTHLPTASGEVFVSALNGADAWTRRQLALAMGAIGYTRGIPVLENMALDDDDVRVRLSAAQSLALLHHPRGETVILRTLNAPSAQTRTWAAIALGNVGNPKALPPLLGNDELPLPKTPADARQVTAEMVAALKRIGAPAVPRLLEGLASPDRVRQEIAFRALTEIGPVAVTALLDALTNPLTPAVHQQIIRLLGLAGDSRAVEPLADILRRGATSTFSPRGVVSALYDSTVEARKLAADALGNLALPACVPPLLSATRFDLDQEVRERAARALATLGDADSVLQLAEPQIFGEASRAFLSLLMLLLVGGTLGVFARLIGYGRVGLLAGLAAGAAVGLVDGLTGHKRTMQGAMFGLGAVALWGVFGSMFMGSPPVRELVHLVPVRIGALFLGSVGIVGGLIGHNPLIGLYRARYVPRGCLSLTWPVVWGGAGALAGGVSGAVLIIRANDPAFFSWLGGIALGVLLVVSWLQRGNRVELQRGLMIALGLLGMVVLSLAFALSIPTVFTAWLMPLFPAVGAAIGFQPQPLIRRMAGLFVGIISGFIGAGLGVWVMGLFV